jgi:hypothetical protein
MPSLDMICTNPEDGIHDLNDIHAEDAQASLDQACAADIIRGLIR